MPFGPIRPPPSPLTGSRHSSEGWNPRPVTMRLSLRGHAVGARRAVPADRSNPSVPCPLSPVGWVKRGWACVVVWLPREPTTPAVTLPLSLEGLCPKCHSEAISTRREAEESAQERWGGSFASLKACPELAEGVRVTMRLSLRGHAVGARRLVLAKAGMPCPQTEAIRLSPAP